MFEKKELTVDELFNKLSASRTEVDGSEFGRTTYLRIGKGLNTGKAWADYVDDSGHRWYLNKQYFPTVRDALQALYDRLRDLTPKK